MLGRRTACVFGLGLMVAGAILQPPLQAQRDSIKIAIPLPARADSLLRDSLRKRDSIAKVNEIQPPTARAELPVNMGIGRVLHWTRDSLFSTGALTVTDLLDRVPGMTTHHAGWLGAPMAASYMGDFHRLRVFFDGLEMPELDPRDRGIMDLTQVNLWAAEEATVEVTATEIRVYIRSWRVRGTTPVTRTDIGTGDQQTNAYRGFFGRRLDNGGVIQFGAQQMGTTPPTIFGTAGDQLGIIGRVGWANDNWSIDAFWNSSGRHRGNVYGELLLDTIPTLQSTRMDSYVRIARGDPDTSPLWAQVMAVGSRYIYTGIRNSNLVTPPVTPRDSVLSFASLDTGVFRSQYIATAGMATGPFRLSATERLFAQGGQSYSVPSVRGSIANRLVTVSAFAEAKNVDSIARMDVTAQLAPLPFVSLLASAGRAADSRDDANKTTTSYVRGEAGLRVRNLWLVGGVMRRDSVNLSPPIEFDTVFHARPQGSAIAATAAIRGQLWRFIYADVSGIRWSDSLGFYRPQYQTRSELFIRTNLIERFPSGNLGILFSAVHEYRSHVLFPIGPAEVARAPGYRTISTLLEIRILSATATWQFRNLLGERYSQVPFFIAPRQTNFYGVRWEFLN